jgi:hypothetical protein
VAYPGLVMYINFKPQYKPNKNKFYKYALNPRAITSGDPGQPAGYEFNPTDLIWYPGEPIRKFINANAAYILRSAKEKYGTTPEFGKSKIFDITSKLDAFEIVGRDLEQLELDDLLQEGERADKTKKFIEKSREYKPHTYYTVARNAEFMAEKLKNIKDLLQYAIEEQGLRDIYELRNRLNKVVDNPDLHRVTYSKTHAKLYATNEDYRLYVWLAHILEGFYGNANRAPGPALKLDPPPAKLKPLYNLVQEYTDVYAALSSYAYELDRLKQAPQTPETQKIIQNLEIQMAIVKDELDKLQQKSLQYGILPPEKVPIRGQHIF